MVQHDPLGRAAGARGVDDAGGLVAAEPFGMGTRVEIAVAVGQDVRPYVQVDTEVLPDLGRFHADHEFHGRRPVCCRDQPLGETAGRNDGALGAAVLEDMQVVGLGIGGVGRHRDAAGGHDGDVGDQPFRPVLGYQDDAVAVNDPKPPQAAGQAYDLF